MAKTITSWEAGKSGNPGGRPSTRRALAEMLRMTGEEEVNIGGELMSGKEALARAVWQFVTTGEVWLQGKKLEADTSSEWLNAVKWLYNTVEPPKAGDTEVEQEMTIRIERVQKPYLNPGAISAFAKAHGKVEYPHPPAPSPLRKEGEQDGPEYVAPAGGKTE